MDIPKNETRESLWEHLNVVEDERNNLLNACETILLCMDDNKSICNDCVNRLKELTSK